MTFAWCLWCNPDIAICGLGGRPLANPPAKVYRNCRGEEAGRDGVGVAFAVVI